MLHDLFIEHSCPMDPIPTGHPERLDPLHDIGAVFFDVYGTLVLSAAGEISKDSDPASGNDPVRKALEAEAIDAPGVTWDTMKTAIAEAHEQAHGSGRENPEVDIRAIWRKILSGGTHHDLQPDDNLLERLAIRCEIAANPTWPEPDMISTIHNLISDGIKLGIISNAQFYTPIMLEAYLAMPLEKAGFHTDLRIWSYEEQTAKPGKELYEKAAGQLLKSTGLEPKNAIMVGNDIRNDIAPAKAVGFKTALYAGDKRSLRLRKESPELQNISPDATITSLSSLARIFHSPP